jgi:hypothetical protein
MECVNLTKPLRYLPGEGADDIGQNAVGSSSAAQVASFVRGPKD